MPIDIPPLSPYPEDMVSSSQVFVVSWACNMEALVAGMRVVVVGASAAERVVMRGCLIA